MLPVRQRNGQEEVSGTVAAAAAATTEITASDSYIMLSYLGGKDLT